MICWRIFLICSLQSQQTVSEDPAGLVGPVAPVAPLDPVAPVGQVAPRYPRGPCGPSQQQLSALLQDGACSAQQLSMQA